MKPLKLLAGAFLLAATAFGSDAIAADPDIKINIDSVTCRDMLRKGGEERDFTIVFMHGFMSGKKGDLVFDAPALTEATDKVLDACINNPDATVLSVFEDVRG